MSGKLEYVTKDQVIEWFRAYGHFDEGIPYNVLAAEIREMKAADVAPVQPGFWDCVDSSYWRWTPSGGVSVSRLSYRCSRCGRGTAIKSNYCPNCGARMDGAE